MSSLNQDTNELQKHLQTRLGNDIKILVGRHKSFGNEDTCLIVNGEKSLEACKVISHGLTKFEIKEETSVKIGSVKSYKYHTISF